MRRNSLKNISRHLGNWVKNVSISKITKTEKTVKTEINNDNKKTSISLNNTACYFSKRVLTV
jgi:hypothetical protein